jgi:hypothetical protein
VPSINGRFSWQTGAFSKVFSIRRHCYPPEIAFQCLYLIARVLRKVALSFFLPTMNTSFGFPISQISLICESAPINLVNTLFLTWFDQKSARFSPRNKLRTESSYTPVSACRWRGRIDSKWPSRCRTP